MEDEEGEEGEEGAGGAATAIPCLLDWSTATLSGLERQLELDEESNPNSLSPNNSLSHFDHSQLTCCFLDPASHIRVLPAIPSGHHRPFPRVTSPSL